MNINHIAKLARLGLGEDEKSKLESELSEILDFVEQLKEVETENIEPTAHATGMENVVRPDEARRTAEDERQEILGNAPQREDNFIKVKSVLQ
ncbi:MAG: Aspartyl/glutamyl-tRNA(Asn/Gln) amidotransferase subunit C [Parcubacteria group bacterium GW2011_GWC1_43_12]|nr:MAG: Aspartyl/glutamyl-tRNA(Asn/Gln) amidotransferase subunit C [Parcubacteria group bacterium GW2011_GWB1_42_6]KKS92053.1 MAG: Aspartyl/glutamyl-tRNA(Asn/Gln) amidotransferase subunit C [Parcubacteria group bacterium GW2011_GWC1_43_12]